MKCKYLFYICLLLSLNSIANRQTKPVKINIVSEEISTINGQITIQLQYIFKDTLIINNLPLFELPDKFNLFESPDLERRVYMPGEKFTADFTVNYEFSENNLPFYPQSILIEQSFGKANNNYFNLTIFTEAKIYFTPYGTIEIWNDIDFYNLKRDWLIDTHIQRDRKYIPKDSIPVSNIPDDFEPQEKWQEDFQEIFIEGLAYAIPMLAVHPDSIEKLNNNIDSSNEATRDACWPLKQYRGNISGNIRSWVRNDVTGNNQHLPMKGLSVEIWEKNWTGKIGFSKKLKITTTDKNGNFNTWVNVCAALEGGELEIFLKVSAENTNYNIIGKHSIILGAIDKEVTGITNWDYNEGNISNFELGVITVNREAMRAVHFATLAGFAIFSFSGLFFSFYAYF